MRKLLGEGAVTSVIFCSHLEVPGGVAMKMYHKDRMSENHFKQVLGCMGAATLSHNLTGLGGKNTPSQSSCDQLESLIGFSNCC